MQRLMRNGTGGLAAAALLLAAGCLSREEIRRIESRPEGTGIQFTRLPEVIRYLASYEATPAQRAGARQQAEALAAQPLAVPAPAPKAEKPEAPAAPAAETKAPEPPPAAPRPAPAQETASAPAVIAPPPASATASPVPAAPVPGPERYIAVAAPRDERARGKQSVMIWDINSREFVNNKVYDIAVPPARGTKVRWEVGSDLLVVHYQAAAPPP